MKPADPLGGLLPPAPPGRDLPHHGRHRGDLLAVVSERTGKRRWPAAWLAPLGAALAVIVIVAGVFVLPGLLGGSRSSGQPGTGPASGPPAASDGKHGPPIQRTESYLVSSAVGQLKVQDSVGGVSITGANRSTISITAHLVYRGGAPVITRRRTGRTLELGYTCPARSRNCGVSFDLTVPRDLGAIVDLEVGPIRLSGLSGTISAHTGVGQIRASGMSAQRVALNTGTGMISAGFTAPPQLIAAHSGVGSVAIRVPSGTAYKVTASTQVGSVRITVPQAAHSSHIIRATTGTGTVTVTGG